MRLRHAGFTLASIASTDATAPLSDGGITTRPGRDEADGELPQGTSLGRYVVLGRLGAGGAGSVYAAYDTQIDRRVALKILHAEDGETDDAWRERWDCVVREARLLGRLNHPNVVTVYDVDTVDGIPFLAMELVDGEDLAQWCAQPRPLPELLAVFVGAARGLQAAHAQDIVHGDFKPANVLVGADGRARVSDFGVARLAANPTDPSDPSGETQDNVDTMPSTAQDDAGHTIGRVAGTPFYMAPEQHDGHRPDARSDIYALCLTLHEAAYGTRAFTAKTYEGLALQKEQGPPSPPEGGPALPGWLRQVLDRGLASKPADRFPDVTALLAALDRPSSPSRGRAAMVVGAVGLTLGAAAWLKPGSTEAPCRGAARHLVGVWDAPQRARVEATMLERLASYAPDAWQRTRQQLDTYAGDWVQSHTGACEATQRGEQSAALLDQRMQCLARKRQSLAALVEVLGRSPDTAVVRRAPDAARALPDIAACDDTAQLGERPTRPDHPDRPRAERDLARAYAWADVGKYTEAMEAARSAETLAAEIADDLLQVETQLAVGSMQAHLGDDEAARGSLSAAHFAAQRLRADELAAIASVRLVTVVGDRLRRAEAGLVWAEHARAAIARAGEEAALAGQLDTHVGTILTQASRLDEAQAAFERAQAAQTEHLGAEAPELAVVFNGLGGVAVARKDYASARNYYGRALDLKREHLGPKHPALGTTWLNLGIAAKNVGDYDDARARYEAARDLWEEALGPEHPSLGTVHNNLGTLASAQGDPSTAKVEYERACEIWRAALDADHPDVAMCLMNLGTVELDLGNLDRARSLLDEALQLRRKRLGDDHPFVAIAHINLGDAGLRAEDPAAALRHFEAALSVWKTTLEPDHPDLAYALTGIARAHMDAGTPTQAVGPLERAVELRTGDNIEPRLAASSRFILARALVAANADRTRARALAVEAQGLFAKAGGTHEAADEIDQWLLENPASP